MRQKKAFLLLWLYFLLFTFYLLLAPVPVSASTTLYLGSLEKTYDDQGNIISEKLYLPAGNATVVKQSTINNQQSTISYLHSDHLSSTVLTTDQSGSKNTALQYYPYGNAQYAIRNTPTDNLYTGQKQDSSSDLYFYNARYYNPTTSHFTSADKAEGPNRYAYVGNNPIMKNDPSGLMDIAETQGGGGGSAKKNNKVLLAIYLPYGNDKEKQENFMASLNLALQLLQFYNANFNLNYDITDFKLLTSIPYIDRDKAYGSNFHIDYRSNGGWNYPESFDYEYFYRQMNLQSGEYAEVWVFAGPSGHLAESVYAGNNNTPIMGFNYERGMDCALENIGHRMEGVLRASSYRDDFSQLIGGSPTSWSSSDEVIRTEAIKDAEYPLVIPDARGIGNVHTPPNAVRTHYDYTQRRMVDIPGFSPHNCSLWGCSQEGYMRWWLGQIAQHPSWISEFANPK